MAFCMRPPFMGAKESGILVGLEDTVELELMGSKFIPFSGTNFQYPRCAFTSPFLSS